METALLSRKRRSTYRCKGQTNACVAAGGLNDNVTFLDSTRLFGVDDHPLTDAVLDGATSVEELAFGQDFALYVAFDLVQSYQGSVTDVIQDGIADLGFGVPVRFRGRGQQFAKEESGRDTSNGSHCTDLNSIEWAVAGLAVIGAGATCWGVAGHDGKNRLKKLTVCGTNVYKLTMH